jgi:hypothetical protein
MGCKMTDVPAEIARLKSEIIRLNVYITNLTWALSQMEDKSDT